MTDTATLKHLTAKCSTVSRKGKPQKGQRLTTTKAAASSGRSMVAAAAYAAGVRLKDNRTGRVHDFRAKGGVFTSFIVGAGGWTGSTDRAGLWNMAELSEKRPDATTGREWVIALPFELSHAQRVALLRQIATDMAERFGVVVDASLHIPNKEGDQRNYHAHLLMTTRKVLPDGTLGEKTRELDGYSGRQLIKDFRAQLEIRMNAAMAAAGRPERVTYKTLKELGIERQAQIHEGVNATNARRRNYRTDAEHAGEKLRHAKNREAGAIASYADSEQLRHLRGMIAANNKALADIAANPVTLPRASKAFRPAGFTRANSRTPEAFVYRTLCAFVEKLGAVLNLRQIIAVTAHAVDHRAQQAQRAAAIREQNRALRAHAKAVLARMMREEGSKGRGAATIRPAGTEMHPTPPPIAAAVARKHEQRRRPQKAQPWKQPPEEYRATRTRPQKARFDHMRAAKKNPHSPKDSPRS